AVEMEGVRADDVSGGAAARQMRGEDAAALLPRLLRHATACVRSDAWWNAVATTSSFVFSTTRQASSLSSRLHRPREPCDGLELPRVLVADHAGDRAVHDREHVRRERLDAGRSARERLAQDRKSTRLNS